MARNILVVEDDNNISNLIKMYLDKEGFDVRIAADGGKAVEEFKEKEPDLVLLDVMLPVLDGWGVCAKIRATSKCPIIMLTAKGEVNDRIHGLEMGADDYVVKPFEMKELLARINAVLRRSDIPEDTHKPPRRSTSSSSTSTPDELIVDGKKIDDAAQGAGASLSPRLPRRTASTRAISCLTRCGASTTSAIRARWTCTSRGSVKRSKTLATSGRSRLSGASDINLK